MKHRRPLIWQLFLSYILVIILALAAVAWMAMHGFEQFYVHQVAQLLETRAKLVATQLDDKVVHGATDEFIDLINSLGQLANTRLTIITGTGEVLADSDKEPRSMENHGSRPEVMMANKTGLGLATRFSYTLQTDMMYVAIKGKSKNEQDYFVRTALPLTKLEKRLANHGQQLALWGLIIALIAAGLSFLISRKIIRPIKAITTGASEFAAGRLGGQLLLPSSSEMATLAQTLNEMAKQLDERIKTITRQRQEQEAMLTAMKEGVIAVDKEETILHINPTACDLFQLTSQIACGQKFQALIRKPELIKFLQHILEKETAAEAELIFYKEGECTILTNGTPLLDEQGKVIGALLVLNDMTGQKKLENIRKEFVANVSHELKTPVTLIQGFVETLIDGAIDDQADAKNFLNKILSNSKRLNLIIEDLLNLSRIEQLDDTTLEMETVSLVDLLEQARKHCAAHAKDNKITLEINCEPKINLVANQNLLEQALINLIDNALKYSQTSKAIQLIGTETGDEIRIEVQDFGIGVAADQLPRLFERFYRLDKGRSRDAGGTGLGLAIVKHIVQVHKGRVEANSVLQKGTSFIIWLPKA